ncbi:MAG: polymer-forming cytoskeletal protein [Hungatella sp.]|nr:polymer-forming cytoskeletal protein [Hungatella sp.]
MFSSKKPKTTSSSMINTIIGDNSKIEGLLLTSDSTRIDGLLQGKILSESSVIIGEHGVIRGDIKAVDILIAGTVYGNIRAESKIEITGTGRVLGDMFTKTLVIDEGASFKGNCTMDVTEDDNSSRPSIPQMEPEEFRYTEPPVEEEEFFDEPDDIEDEDKDMEEAKADGAKLP